MINIQYETVHVFLYHKTIPEDVKEKLQLSSQPPTGASWFKEGTSLQTVLIRWILSLKSLSEWSQTDHLLHLKLTSGVSSSHLICSVQCSCSQVSTAEPTAGLAWELQMFSRLPWNMLLAMPKNQAKAELVLNRSTDRAQARGPPLILCKALLWSSAARPCPGAWYSLTITYPSWAQRT